jgi:hypothetical protein
VLLKSLCGGSNTDIDQSQGSTTTAATSSSSMSNGSRISPSAPGVGAKDSKGASKKQTSFFDQLTPREAMVAAALLFFAIMYA